ncbi:nuclear transport factor 2 family protein [Xanthobacter sp. KR7-225]|uniref:nuclear transport factor 2 family protein n=1 Tax=Xanthobacter sp. KR7-225 TaxID=3156613 RepID=UPI0032B5C715
MGAAFAFSEDIVLELEASRRQAMLNGAEDDLDRLLAEDMLWVHGSSAVDGKSSFIAKFRAGDLRCFDLDYTEPSIRLYGRTALVSGTVNMDVAILGERRRSTNRYVCVWSLVGNAPQLVHWQSTRIP